MPEEKMKFDYLDGLVNKVDGINQLPLDEFVKEQWIGEELENLWIENYKLNKNKAKVFEFDESAIGKACILVGASPAIKKHVNELNQIDENFIIISSNKAYEFLVQNDIQPDYVFTVEGRPHIKTGLLSGSKGKTILITSPFVCPEVLDNWDGEKYFYPMGGGKRFSKIIDNDFECRDMGGGNVINTSMLWAYKYLGCRDFILMGVSLCYYDDYYHDQSSTDTIGVDLEKWGKYQAVDIYGRAVKTTPALTMYKTWFECYSKIAGCNFINATEDGILGVYLDPIEYKNGNASFKVKYLPWLNIVPLRIAIKGYKLKFKEKKTNDSW